MTNKLPKSLFLPLYFYLKTFYLLSITIFRRFFDCLEQKKKRLERINSKDEQCAYSAEEISSLFSGGNIIISISYVLQILFGYSNQNSIFLIEKQYRC